MGNELVLPKSGRNLVFQPNYPDNRRAQRETIEFRYAQIIYRNFAGKPSQYNEEGSRNFSVLLDEALAADLTERGLNIKPVRKTDEDDQQMYHLPVAVSYRIRPPRIYMVTGNPEAGIPLRKQMLPEDMAHMMDNLELSEAHLMVAISNYEVRGTKGKKAYLQSFFGFVLMDSLEQEYASIEDIIVEDVQTHFEEDNVIEGEIVP